MGEYSGDTDLYLAVDTLKPFAITANAAPFIYLSEILFQSMVCSSVPASWHVVPSLGSRWIGSLGKISFTRNLIRKS